MKSICLREEIYLLARLLFAIVNMIQNEMGKFCTCLIAPTFPENPINRILFCWSCNQAVYLKQLGLQLIFKQGIFCHSCLFLDLEDLS